MRKPEERIYQHTLDLLNVRPHEAVFLDDLGGNVKAARELGIKTIKVRCYDNINKCIDEPRLMSSVNFDFCKFHNLLGIYYQWRVQSCEST